MGRQGAGTALCKCCEGMQCHGLLLQAAPRNVQPPHAEQLLELAAPRETTSILFDSESARNVTRAQSQRVCGGDLSTFIQNGSGLPVLLLAHSRAKKLLETLQSLSTVRGFSPDAILVSQDGKDDEAGNCNKDQSARAPWCLHLASGGKGGRRHEPFADCPRCEPSSGRRMEICSPKVAWQRGQWASDVNTECDAEG